MILITSRDGSAGFTFNAAYEVDVKRSVHEPAATATVKLPVTAVLVMKDGTRTTKDTAQTIRVGDKIDIKLGYNWSLNTEFVGYVTRINHRSPMEIECEDFFYETRGRNVTLSGTRTLASLIEACGLMAGTVQKLKLRNFVVPDKPVSWVIGKLAEYGIKCWFDIFGKFHAVGTEYPASQTAVYKLRYNVVSEEDLKYHTTFDRPVKVKAVGYLPDGRKLEVTAGEEEGEEKTIYTYDIESEKELQEWAETQLARVSFDGYEGKFTAFLEPYARPGGVARITDPNYPQRDGEFRILSVDTKYGESGGRRTIEIGGAI